MGEQGHESRYKTTHRHTIWRGLAIYKVGASPYWRARYYDRAAKRYVTISTKETLKRDAIAAAEAMARTGRLRAPQNESPKEVAFEKTFEYFARKSLEATRVKGKKYAARDDERILTRVDDGLISYFGSREIDSITSAEVIEYFAMLDEMRAEPLSASTKNKHRFVLSRVFKAAVEERVLTRIPTIQTFSAEDTPRPAFSDSEYDHLLNVARDCIRRGVQGTGNGITAETYNLIRFMVSSFVRPLTTELMAIRLGDITARSDKKSLEIKLKGKTGARVSVTMRDGAEILADQISCTTQANKSDYLFFPDMPDRSRALTVVRQNFNHILTVSGLKFDYEKNARTLYSLRHYAIQKRLKDSGGATNLYTLAKNAGTSVEMLQRFYLAKMALSEEMIRNLHHDHKEKEAERNIKGKVPLVPQGPYVNGAKDVILEKASDLLVPKGGNPGSTSKQE